MLLDLNIKKNFNHTHIKWLCNIKIGIILIKIFMINLKM